MSNNVSCSLLGLGRVYRPEGVEVVSLELGLRILLGSQLPLCVRVGVSFSTAPQISYLVVFKRKSRAGVQRLLCYEHMPACMHTATVQ